MSSSANANATVWVLGARGMLGQAVCAALARRGTPYVTSGRDVDVTDAAALARFAGQNPSGAWINCAAMTAVDACEHDEAAAARNDAVNARAPGLLAQLAKAYGAHVVHVSTDYVFAGTATAPYAEDAPVAPNSAYGRAKAAGEQAFWRELGDAAGADAGAGGAGATAGKGYVVRTSWLFGPHGNNFVTTMLGLMKVRPQLQVVHDQRGRPSYTVDLAEALLDLLAADAAPGTYHFANDGATTWHGFAEAILAEARAQALPLACQDVAAVTTDAFPRPAPRPAYSVLATGKLAGALGRAPRDYKGALRDYLKVLSGGAS